LIITGHCFCWRNRLGKALLIALLGGCGGAQAEWVPPTEWALEPAMLTVFRATNDATRAALLTPQELGALMDRAHMLVDQGAYTEAADIFDVISRGLPNWYAYRAGYIQALWRGRGDIDGGLAQSDRCLELDPDNLDCIALRGILLAEAGDVEDAISILLTVVDEPSVSDEVLRLRLGILLLRNDRSGDALRVLSPLASADRLSVLDRIAYARAAEETGELELAEESYQWVRDHHLDEVRGAAFLRDFLRRTNRGREADLIDREIQAEIERRSPNRPMRRL
jgi:tetratricopeptide (TPR) repeat protein